MKNSNYINKTLSNLFSMNRDEEEGSDDLWGTYVLPTNYPQYNLLNYEKSVHITGGRGMGKTAYLKYHCYPTILSNNKTNIPDTALNRIGIYIRLDSELLADMSQESINKDWNNAFNVYIGLSILIELSKFLKMFVASPHIDDKYKTQANELILPSRLLSFLNIEGDLKFINFEEEGHYLRSDLTDWLCDTEQEMPFKFKAKDKVGLFIQQIKKIEIFKDTKFIIFVDEFENLYHEHQKIINTWIKHVPSDMIFHVAYKKYYTPESNTIGQEQIQVNNDYRVINLEDDVYGKSEFSLLASEIVLSKLHKYFDKPFEELNINDYNYLSEESYLLTRKEDEYIKKLQSINYKEIDGLTVLHLVEGMAFFAQKTIKNTTLNHEEFTTILNAFSNSIYTDAYLYIEDKVGIDAFVLFPIITHLSLSFDKPLEVYIFLSKSSQIKDINCKDIPSNILNSLISILKDSYNGSLAMYENPIKIESSEETFHPFYSQAIKTILDDDCSDRVLNYMIDPKEMDQDFFLSLSRPILFNDGVLLVPKHFDENIFDSKEQHENMLVMTAALSYKLLSSQPLGYRLHSYKGYLV